MAKLLLDTHALLWALYDTSYLPSSLLGILKHRETELYVSYATVWELTDKTAKGRIPMAGESPVKIISDIRELGVGFLAIEESDIVRAVSLPLHHSDPYDRMLIAQAQVRRLTLVSKDGNVSKYDVPVLWK